MNKVISSRLPLVLGLLFIPLTSIANANAAHADRAHPLYWRSESRQTTLSIAQSPLTSSTLPFLAAQPSISQGQQIWGCRAEGTKRIYVVDQLNRNANSFDMAIYERSRKSNGDNWDNGKYIGTAQVNVTQKEPGLVGRGQIYNSTLEVNAFGRTVAFYVKDSVDGQASGRCSVEWQMADSETRRLVRQCLALVESKYNGVSEVARFRCTGDPSSYIEELQRQK
jgi:hypothetical protein